MPHKWRVMQLTTFLTPLSLVQKKKENTDQNEMKRSLKLKTTISNASLGLSLAAFLQYAGLQSPRLTVPTQQKCAINTGKRVPGTATTIAAHPKPGRGERGTYAAKARQHLPGVEGAAGQAGGSPTAFLTRPTPCLYLRGGVPENPPTPACSQQRFGWRHRSCCFATQRDAGPL